MGTEATNAAKAAFYTAYNAAISGQSISPASVYKAYTQPDSSGTTAYDTTASGGVGNWSQRYEKGGVLSNILSRVTLTSNNFDQVYFAAKEQGAKQSELDKFLNDAIEIGALTQDSATELRDARFSSVADTYLAAKQNGAKTADLDKYLTRAISGGRISMDDATALREYRPKQQEEDTGLFSENGKWLKKGSDDFGESLLASGLDAISDVSAGIIAGPEGLFRGFAALGAMQDDLNFYQNGGIYTLEQEQKHREQAEQSKSAAAELITKDYYDEDSIAKSILTGLGMGLYNDSITSSGRALTQEDLELAQQFNSDYRKYLDEDMEDDSVLGEQMDGLARSAGQQIFTKAIGGVLPWQLTTGFSTMGDEMAQALNEGATFEEAGASGLVSAAGEVLSEYIFDADIFGHSSFEEKLVKEISNKVSNKVLQAAMKFGMDATGEGLEEVISGVIGAIGQKLTYGSDKEIKELFSSEEMLDSFIGGAIMGGVNSAANGAISKATGTDYVSGLNKSEQAVVDKIYKEQLKEKTTEDGKKKKVSGSEKTAIYNDVLNSLEKGYFSTDSIEAALGGKAYDDYQSLLKSKEDNDALKKYDELRTKKKLQPGEKETLKQLRKQVKQIQENRNALKQKLDTEVARQVQGTKLEESYAERGRRGKAFEADLSQYEGKQKEIVQKAVESGVLNNTNRTHEFVDLISQFAESSNQNYSFTNNETLKKAGLTIEGKQVNGYITKDGLTININSSQALNRVTSHEITHMLEGTEQYEQLQKALTDHAQQKGELDTRRSYVEEQYKNIETNIEQELTAELAGDYLFSDSKFLEKLATDDPKLFQKARDKIEYFSEVAGTRTKEGKQLAKVKELYKDAFREAKKAKKNTIGDGETKYSIGEIVGEDNKSYGTGVQFDSTLLDNLSDSERVKIVKEYVKELGGTALTAYDANGDPVTISIAAPGEKFVNKSGKSVQVNKDLTGKFNKDKVKQEAIAHIEEVALAANFTGAKDSTHPHDWLDNNGENQWEYWKTYVKDKNNTIWQVTLNVANAKDGRKILYDVDGMKKVRGSVSPSDTSISLTKDSIAPTGDKIKYNVSDSLPSTTKTNADVFGEEVALAPTKEDIAAVQRVADGDFAATADKGMDTLKEWAESSKPKKETSSDKAAKQYLKNTLNPKNMPDGVKEKLGSNFEKVSKATTEATDFMLHGNEKAKPLSEIMNSVAQSGFDGEFDLYMQHLLNIDRMSLEERGYGDNKQLFPTEVTAKESEAQAAKLLKEHPEFKEYEADVRAYVDHLRDVLVDGGDISPETAQLWQEMYPHYIPIRRQGFSNDHETWQLLSSILNGESWVNEQGEVDDDLFAAHTATVSKVHQATGGDQQLYPLFDTLAERTLTAYWNAALNGNNATQDIAPIGENVVQNNAVGDAIAPTKEDIAKMEAPADDFAPIREDIPAKADNLEEQAALEKELLALTEAGDFGDKYYELTDRWKELREKTAAESSGTDSQAGNPAENNQPTPEPAKRTFTSEESADSLNVDTPDIGAEEYDTETVVYDPTKVSAEVYREMNPLKWVREKILDNGMVFEELSHKTGNNDLQALWNYTRLSSSKAQNMIGNGVESKGITSITEIYQKATDAGKLDDFYSYLGHCRNIDGMTKRVRYGTADNQSFMGRDVSLYDSRKAKVELESKNPEFKSWAQQCYDYTDYQIDTLVEHGFLTGDDADVWRDVWKHYVPIKSTADGNNAGILETMSEQTLHVQSAAAMNDFAVELMHTLDSKISETAVPVEELVSYFDHGDDLFQVTTSDNGWYYFNCYEDGKLCKFQISEEMYLALKPASDLMKARVPGLADFSEFRRKAITEYNVFFAAGNSIKDAQTVLVQSQHPRETYANMPGAAWDILNDGEYYQEYIANGGDDQQYFHKSTKSLDESVGDKIKKYSGLDAIGDLNNFIETVPRYAEYKVSRMKGASIQVALLDSARVTTNFAAGGELTKFANRNGATFLNASVQGTVQLARTVKEAQMNGVKGWLSLAGRLATIGAAKAVLDHLWDDDEDYEALPDYIKEGYYIVGKGEDGTLYRLPKERTWAVIQYAIEQVSNAATGDATADWNRFFDLCIDNLAPNNPLTNNVFSPLVQVAKDETWYGEDLTPRRLQDLPSTEQFDDKTSDLSVWLSQQLHDAAERNTPDLQPELTDVDLKNGIDTEAVLDKLGDLSPKKIHYLLDQYSGVVGDLLLPLNTPKAEGKSDSLLGKMVADPLRNIFTTDSVLNNRVTDEFYTLQEELEAKVNDGSATLEEQLMNSAIISANVEAGKLYQQQRDLQTSDLPDSEKYEKNREIKKKINTLMENALDDLADIHIDGNYAEVGDDHYTLGTDKETGKETWYVSKPKKADGSDNYYYIQEQLSHENLGMDYADIANENYPDDYTGKNLYAEYNGQRYRFDTEEHKWKQIKSKNADGSDSKLFEKERTARYQLGIEYEEFWNNQEKYDDILYAGHLWDDSTQGYNKDYYDTIRYILGVDEYAEYCDVLPTLKADKDANGNSISGTKKKKVKEYINSLDIPDVQKHILFKVYYPYTKTYNYEIFNYINNADIPYSKKVAVLEEMGASVDAKGKITWKK